jgi:type I restriction enzyme S subunit
LGDICDITSSKRIFAREYRTFGIPFYRGKEIIEKQADKAVSNELYIEKERFSEIKKKFGVPQKGDLLLTSVGTLGVPYVVKDEEFYFKDGNITWFRNFRNSMSSFIYYWLLSPEGRKQIDSKSIGSTQKALTIDALLSFEITLPPIDEQRRIVDTLSALDAIIAANKAINHRLEQMAQAIWAERFDYNEPNGVLGDIIELFDYKRVPLSGNQRDKMGKVYPYYGAASLMDYVDDFLFDGVYLLLGEDGTVIDSLGYPTLQYVWGKFWVNNHAHILQGKNGFTVESLYTLLKQTSVTSIVTGAVQLKINQANLKSLGVFIPAPDELEEFNALIKPFFEQIRVNSDENQRLSTLRDALLPRLMSGELSVVGCAPEGTGGLPSAPTGGMDA